MLRTVHIPWVSDSIKYRFKFNSLLKQCTVDREINFSVGKGFRRIGMRTKKKTALILCEHNICDICYKFKYNNIMSIFSDNFYLQYMCSFHVRCSSTETPKNSPKTLVQ